MIKHIVFWKLTDAASGTVSESAYEIKRRLEELSGRIPGLLRIEVGIDISRTTSSADVALYSEFVDRQALDAYQSHPEHLAVADYIAGVREFRMVVDYEV